MMIPQRCLHSSMVHAQDSWTLLFYFQNCYWWCWSINENVNNFASSDELAFGCMVSRDGWNSDQNIIPAALWCLVLLHVGTTSFCDRKWFEIKHFTKPVRWLNPYRLLTLMFKFSPQNLHMEGESLVPEVLFCPLHFPIYIFMHKNN